MNVQNRIPEPSVVSPPLRRRKRGWLRRNLGSLFLLILVSGAAGAYYFYEAPPPPTGTPIIVTASRGNIEDLITAVGNLQPLTTVDVGAQVSGQLTKLDVMIGDNVEKGQNLAEIDSAVMSAKVDAGTAQLQNLQAQLAERQSQLALAKLQADRQARLMKDNATSQDAFDTADAAAKVAEAQVKSIEAQINQSQSTLKADRATLSYGKIFAPMTGTVTAIPAKQGQTLNANQQAPTILTLSDLTTMTVSTQVSEADVSKLRLGMEAYFTTLGNANRRYTGTLRQILPTPTVLNNVVLYTALFDVPNPNRQLMTQMTAQVFFVRAAARDAITVPVAALRFTGNGGTAAGNSSAPPGAAAQGTPQQAAGARNGGGRNGAGRNGGGRRGGRRGQNNAPATDESENLQPRAATVSVVKDDGSQETRSVMVGVTDRVTAQIISGLVEGEKVVAGMETSTDSADDPAPQRGLLGGLPFRGFR